MTVNFPDKLEGVGKSFWTDKLLFTVNKKSKNFYMIAKAKIFHTFIMKRVFLCLQGRQEIQPGITFLVNRTTETNEGD